MTNRAKSSGDHTQTDPNEVLQDIMIQSRQMIEDFMEQQKALSGGANLDPLNIGSAFLDFTYQAMQDPARLWQAQMGLWQDYMRLWQEASQSLARGEAMPPVIRPQPGDRRFKDDSWDEPTIFNFIKQSYLLTAKWMQSYVADTDGMSPRARQKVDFYTRQFIDAVSPSNFLLTNPQVLKATAESGGQNLMNGLQNLLEDLKRGGIRMTDMDAFTVGENLATTPGKVVYQNDLMQLIQYEPTTEQVHKTPLLIIPPWINKFYILDLKEKNSFVRWALAQGYTVFMISWANPDETLAEKAFDDYMAEGPLAALDAIKDATGENEVTAIGYCIGGTLLAATLAYMAEKDDKRIKAATFFTAQVDFADAGELTLFVDDEQLKSLESRMESGYLEGRDMAATFNMLRANDLIWFFVVNNYLLGKDPFPFDLLYWNSDTTRLPRATHLYYLREMYNNNNLVKPGALTMKGVPIDLTKITTPAYFQAGKEDHIAPYPSVFKAVELFKGPVKFMLAGSGHIAGVINPPEAKKYGYWTNPENPRTLDKWMDGAKEHAGSWWPDWDAWQKPHSGAMVPARKPGAGKLKAIEDAPGSYVKVSYT
jgi:polyhydroxyalkanoate synthase